MTWEKKFALWAPWVSKLINIYDYNVCLVFLIVCRIFFTFFYIYKFHNDESVCELGHNMAVISSSLAVPQIKQVEINMGVYVSVDLLGPPDVYLH